MMRAIFFYSKKQEEQYKRVGYGYSPSTIDGKRYTEIIISPPYKSNWVDGDIISCDDVTDDFEVEYSFFS